MPTFDAGTARYRIELDTSNMQNQFTQVTTGFNKLDMSIQNLGKSGGALASNFKSLGQTFQAGSTPLQNFQQQAGALPKAFNTINDAADKNLKKMKGIGEFFRSNKGLVFGGAGLASAAAEAAGMLGMYRDAVAQNAEAQKNLQEVQADTTSSTQDVARAEQDAAKAKKWLSMSTRNLVLSQMDQVFFATMVISQLSQMNLKGGILGRTLGHLKTAFTGAAGAQGLHGMANGLTAGIDALGNFGTKATATSKVMTVLKNNLGILIGAFAGFAASIVIINQVQSSVEAFYKTIQAKPKTTNLLDEIFDPKKFKEGMEETKTIMELTGASLGEFQTNAEGVGKRFLEMGGQIDKAGNVVAQSAEHYFTLGDGLSHIGKTSSMYIAWTAQRIAKGEEEGKTMQWLTKESLIPAEQALRIYTIAKKDAVRLEEEGIDPAKTYAKIVRDRTAAEQQGNAILDEYLGVAGEVNLTTEQGMADLESYLHAKLDDAAATDTQKKNTEDFIQVILALAQAREDETQALGNNMKKSQEYLDKKIQLEGEHLQKHLDYLKKREEAETKALGDNLQNSLDYLKKKEEAETKALGDNLQNSLDYLKKKEELETKAQGDNLQNSLDYLRKKEEDETKAQGDNLQNSLDYLKKKEELETKAQGDNLKNSLEYLRKKRKAEIEAQQDIIKRINEAQSEIASALDIKLKDKDKMTKKLFDYFPDNIAKKIKADIKFDLNLKTAKESIIDSMWAAVGADLPEDQMDKLVKKTIKFLKEKFGEKNPEVQKMINQLFATIGSDDTASEVAALMSKWEAAPIPVQIDSTSLQEIHNAIKAALAGETYIAPVIGELQSVDIGWGEVGEDVMSKLDTRGARFNKSSKSTGEGGKGMPVVPVAGELTLDRIFFGAGGTNPAGPGAGGSGIGQLWVGPDGSIHIGGGAAGRSGMGNGQGSDGWIIPVTLGESQGLGMQLGIIGKALTGLEIVAQKLQTGFANLANQGVNSFNILAKGSSKAMTGIKKNILVGEVAAQNLQTGLANLANEGDNSLSIVAKSSSKNMNATRKNLNVGYVAAGHLQTGLANLANEGSDSLMDLAKASSKAMNGLINNLEKAEDAVHSLQSAIDSLHGKTVTVKYRQEGAPQSQGGVYSFAEGGTVSAAGGLATVHQPTHFIYGDNPGNTETLAFIPHNNPGPILDKLDKIFSRNSKGGIEVGQNITLNISGNDIVNSVKLNRRIRTVMGSNMDRFG